MRARVGLRTVDATRAALRSARADATHRIVRLLLFVDAPVAVIVESVADRVDVAAAARRAAGHDHAGAAATRAVCRARARTAGHDLCQIVLVERAVAVVVDTVATCVTRSRRSRHAAIDDRTVHAARVAVRRAVPHPAAGCVRHEAFILRAVAVVVDAVTRRIVRPRRTGRASIDDGASDAARQLTALTSADTASHVLPRVVFVDRAVAIVVDAIARTS